MLDRRTFIAAAAGLPAFALTGGSATAATLDPAMKANLKSLQALRGSVGDTAFDGRPLLVTFFASWCPPCRAEMSELANYIAQNGNGVSMIAVNWMEDFAGPVSRSRLKRFVDVIHPDIPVVVGNTAPGRALNGIHAVPAVVIFDSAGQEVFKLGGGHGEIGRHYITQRRLTGIIRGLSS
ncbi:MAG: TlpA family protein disulfide reductase [Alphaproteobacteria bacterium]